ncbi:MAG: slipin family protein [Raoultibacter sp.]
MKKNYQNKDNQSQREMAPRMASTELEPNSASRGSVYLVYWLVLLVGFAGGFFVSFALPLFVRIGAGIIVALLLAYAIRIAPQWERVVILRLGRFHKIAGPGLFFCIPFIDHVSIHVDQRIMISSFSAEAALTADLVPVDVDAVLFWMVWDVKKACLEVENYPKAVLCSAQTALRDAIGMLSLSDISLRRREIDRELKEHLTEKCEDWGITVMSVEIRNIVVPKELQDALSKEAQAECEKNARILLAEIEKDISAMYVEAAGVYGQNDKALQLRALNLAYDAAKDGKGSLIIPSSLAEGFNVNLISK